MKNKSVLSPGFFWLVFEFMVNHFFEKVVLATKIGSFKEGFVSHFSLLCLILAKVSQNWVTRNTTWTRTRVTRNTTWTRTRVIWNDTLEWSKKGTLGEWPQNWTRVREKAFLTDSRGTFLNGGIFGKQRLCILFFLTYIIRWSQWQSPPSLKFRKKVKTLCFWTAPAFKFGRPKFHVPDDLNRSGDINLESPTGGPRPNFSVSPLRNSPTYLKYPWLGIALLHFISLASTLASRVDGSIWTHQLGSPRR